MTKCPHCDQDIKVLHYFSKVQVMQAVSLDNNNRDLDYDSIDDYGDHTDEEYVCPICGWRIAENEKDAKKFLKSGISNRGYLKR